MTISSEKPYSNYVVREGYCISQEEEESKSSKSNEKLTLDIDAAKNIHPRQWRDAITRHNTFLHSEPIIPKVLVKGDNNYRDCYGFVVGKKYLMEGVKGSVDNHAFVYEGGWLGGKL